MTDQTPVTDDDAREMHAWCDSFGPSDENQSPLAKIIRYVRATLPAPPATLADELRTIAHAAIGADGYPIFGGDSEILDLADRVEAEAKRKDLHADNQRKELARLNDRVMSLTDLYSQAETSLGDVAIERDDARAERDEERQRNDDLSRGCEGRGAAEWKAAYDSARAEVERLTEQQKRLIDQRNEAQDLVYEARKKCDEARAENKSLIHNRDARRGQVEKALAERDEARAEVELLAAQIDRLVETYASEVERLTRENSDLTQRVDSLTVISDEAVSLGYWLADKLGEHVDDQDDETLTETVQRLTERLTATFKETLKEPGHLPDPADVPESQPYFVTFEGGQWIGLRSDPADVDEPWQLVNLNDTGIAWTSDAKITLVSRLVPDTRRVIDRVEGLDALPVGSIVRDKNGNPWKILQDGLADGPVMTMNIEGVLNRVGPVTVIHEPMSDSADSGDGRTPDCPTQG